MTLYDRAVLTMEAADRDLVFELRGDLSDTEEIERSFPAGGRGQLLRNAIDWVPGVSDLERRKGYYVDIGGGSHAWRLQIPSAGVEPDQWGDGSADPGEVNRYDAATDAHPYAKKQVLAYWLSQSRSDSFGNVKLHVGEHTDGTYSDAAGAFETPIRAGIQSAQVGISGDDPAAIDVSLEVSWAATFPSTADPGDIDTGLLPL